VPGLRRGKQDLTARTLTPLILVRIQVPQPSKIKNVARDTWPMRTRIESATSQTIGAAIADVLGKLGETSIQPSWAWKMAGGHVCVWLGRVLSDQKDNWCRENTPDGLNSPRQRRILVQREMCPRAVVIVHIRKEHMAQVPLAKDNDMVSCRIEPISRSVWPFCHGDWGAVGRSRMPMARSRRVKISP
jgi:hypothetical protein